MNDRASPSDLEENLELDPVNTDQIEVDSLGDEEVVGDVLSWLASVKKYLDDNTFW